MSFVQLKELDHNADVIDDNILSVYVQTLHFAASPLVQLAVAGLTKLLDFARIG